MKIKVSNEGWFKTAPFHDVKMLGVKYLGVPAERFDSKQAEHFKRAMVRQVYNKSHVYGEEFEIVEPENPFGAPKKRQLLGFKLAGPYVYVACTQRVPSTDIRWKMIEVVKKHTELSACQKELTETFEAEYPTNKEKTFKTKEYLSWCLKCGWIMKI